MANCSFKGLKKGNNIWSVEQAYRQPQSWTQKHKIVQLVPPIPELPTGSQSFINPLWYVIIVATQ